MSKEIWYVEFPTYKYKEDVKELEETLFIKWKANLPEEIHQNCI